MQPSPKKGATAELTPGPNKGAPANLTPSPIKGATANLAPAPNKCAKLEPELKPINGSERLTSIRSVLTPSHNLESCLDFETCSDSENPESISVNFCVVNQEGNLITSELEKAVNHTLCSDKIDHYIDEGYINVSERDGAFTEENEELLQYGLNSIKVEDGRIVMPIFWNK